MTQPVSPMDALWQPRALVWALALVLGLAAVLALAPATPANGLPEVTERFGLYAFLGAWIVLLAMGGLYALRSRLKRLSATTIAWIAMALLIVSTLAVCTAGFLALGQQGEVSLRIFLVRTAGISTSVGLLAMGGFRTVRGNIELRAAARQAELAALQARVHPHFLFNSLNTAVALVRQQPQKAETLLVDLADLFRAALSAARDVPLSQELQLCERYLAIEKLRLGDRLSVRWSLPSPLPDPVVPSLLVQPLVENAVRHGIEPHDQGGEICIEVEFLPRELVIRVSNPMPATAPRKDGHHIGQRAVRSRIALATQERGRLQTRVEDGRYIACISLPVTGIPEVAADRA